MELTRRAKLILTLFGFGVFMGIYSIPFSESYAIRLIVAFVIGGPIVAFFLLQRSKEPLSATPSMYTQATYGGEKSKEVRQFEMAKDDEERWRRLAISMIDGGGIDVEARAEGIQEVLAGGIKFTFRGTGKPVPLKKDQIIPESNVEEETSALASEPLVS